MPLLLIPFLVGGSLGFGGGFIANDGLKTLCRIAVFGGLAFGAYKWVTR